MELGPCIGNFKRGDEAFLNLGRHDRSSSDANDSLAASKCNVTPICYTRICHISCNYCSDEIRKPGLAHSGVYWGWGVWGVNLTWGKTWIIPIKWETTSFVNGNTSIRAFQEVSISESAGLPSLSLVAKEATVYVSLSTVGQPVDLLGWFFRHFLIQPLVW